MQINKLNILTVNLQATRMSLLPKLSRAARASTDLDVKRDFNKATKITSRRAIETKRYCRNAIDCHVVGHI